MTVSKEDIGKMLGDTSFAAMYFNMHYTLRSLLSRNIVRLKAHSYMTGAEEMQEMTTGELDEEFDKLFDADWNLNSFWISRNRLQKLYNSYAGNNEVETFYFVPVQYKDVKFVTYEISILERRNAFASRNFQKVEELNPSPPAKPNFE